MLLSFTHIYFSLGYGKEKSLATFQFVSLGVHLGSHPATPRGPCSFGCFLSSISHSLLSSHFLPYGLRTCASFSYLKIALKQAPPLRLLLLKIIMYNLSPYSILIHFMASVNWFSLLYSTEQKRQ